MSFLEVFFCRINFGLVPFMFGSLGGRKLKWKKRNIKHQIDAGEQKGNLGHRIDFQNIINKF